MAGNAQTEDKVTNYVRTLLWGLRHEHPKVSTDALETLSKFL